jgi:predicted dehydrogenase
MPLSTAKPPAIVVGTGFGARIHVPALRAAGYEVVGLVGTDAELTQRRAAAVGVPKIFTDLDEAISRTRAVVVTVATPPHTHAALTIAAMARGCHVICEKPIATNAAEARRMLEVAERAGVTHLVGHEFRWSPERALVARAINEGLIGQPKFVSLVQYAPLLASAEVKMPRWWFDRAAGGGWLGASGSHAVDQLRTWLGEFASVSAALPSVSACDVEDSLAVRFKLANGADGVLHYTGGAWGPPVSTARVAGTQGTVWIEAGAVKIADRDGVRELAMPADLALPPDVGSDARHPSVHQELAPYIRLCEALRAGIEGRKPLSPVQPATFVDGLACMEVLDAIRQSAATGGALVSLASE